MKNKLSLNQEAIAGLAKVLVAVIIAVVVGYSEVMYLQIMSRAFPDGILKIVAMIGAVGTGLSVLTLLIAKAYWFRPGGQMVAAWLFTGVEVMILLLNVLLSFALDGGKVDGYLAVWYTLTPSSPLFALVGWTLILHLDRGQQERHADMELEVEMQRAERQHKIATHEAKMQLRESFLKSHTTYLQQEVNSPEIQRQLAIGASAMAAQELSALTGMHIAPRLNGPQFPNDKTVESRASSALPQPKDVDLATGESDEWLARVNERVEQERAARLQQGEDVPAASSSSKPSGFFTRLKGQVTGENAQARASYQAERWRQHRDSIRRHQEAVRQRQEAAQVSNDEPSSVQYRARRPGQL